MIDRIFAPALTFAMLIAGTAVITSSLFGHTPGNDMQVAQGMPSSPIVLERVVITAKRAQAEPKAAPAPVNQGPSGPVVPAQRVQG